MAKKWYRSRTVWVNIVAAGVSLAAAYGFDVSIEEGVAFIAVVNLVVRAITSQPLER